MDFLPLPPFRWRSSQGSAAAGIIALAVISVLIGSYEKHMERVAAIVEKSSQINLSSHDIEEFLNNLSSKLIKRVDKKLAKLGQPQPGMPYSLPDVLHRLDAVGFPNKTWEVSSAKYSWKMNVTEAGMRYWANQVREAHIMDLELGTHAFAVRCILAFNRENYAAVELLWGWKVFLGADYSDRKSCCWRTSHTLSEMRDLASMQRSGKFTLNFVDEITDICAE